jgi:hypothetical protein
MERASGGVTYGPSNKNNTMMHKGKIPVESSYRRTKTKATRADVMRKGEDTDSERRIRFTKNIDLRDHSLETIPLMK